MMLTVSRAIARRAFAGIAAAAAALAIAGVAHGQMMMGLIGPGSGAVAGGSGAFIISGGRDFSSGADPYTVTLGASATTGDIVVFEALSSVAHSPTSMTLDSGRAMSQLGSCQTVSTRRSCLYYAVLQAGETSVKIGNQFGGWTGGAGDAAAAWVVFRGFAAAVLRDTATTASGATITYAAGFTPGVGSAALSVHGTSDTNYTAASSSGGTWTSRLAGAQNFTGITGSAISSSNYTGGAVTIGGFSAASAVIGYLVELAP